MFQPSTIVSLVEGLYDGNVPYRDVMRHADFGVGTFNASTARWSLSTEVLPPSK